VLHRQQIKKKWTVHQLEGLKLLMEAINYTDKKQQLLKTTRWISLFLSSVSDPI
jgi:hypothetical protein